MSALFDGLPALLLEIAEVVAEATDDPTGLRAALAIARARGGQRVRILPALDDNGWLIAAVGREAAAVIVSHFSGLDNGEQIDVPMGPETGHNAEARKRRAIIETGLAEGRSIDDIAREANCTRRWVFEVQAQLGEDKPDPRQMSFFGDAA